MKKYIFIAIALVLVSVLVAQRFDNMQQRNNCQENHRMEKGRMSKSHDHGMMMMRIMRELELSEDQTAQLQENRIKMEKNRISLRAEIQTLKVDEDVARKNMDFTALKKLNNSISDLKKELKNKQIDNMEKCWNILTEEQKEQAKELIKNPPHKMQHQNKDCEGQEKRMRRQRNEYKEENDQ